MNVKEQKSASNEANNNPEEQKQDRFRCIILQKLEKQ